MTRTQTGITYPSPSKYTTTKPQCALACASPTYSPRKREWHTHVYIYRYICIEFIYHQTSECRIICSKTIQQFLLPVEFVAQRFDFLRSISENQLLLSLFCPINTLKKDTYQYIFIYGVILWNIFYTQILQINF